ncbi:MAG: DUF2339 domain-containing protein [Verrucomicrobium sp.]
MEALGILILLVVIGFVFVMPIVVLSHASAARKKAEDLDGQLRNHLQRSKDEHYHLMRRIEALESQRAPATAPPAVEPAPEVATAAPEKPAAAAEPVIPPISISTAAPEAPPALPTPEDDEEEEMWGPIPPLPAACPDAPPLPPPLPPKATSTALLPPSVEVPPAMPIAAKAAEKATPAFTLEQFMGVKLFAWVGGLALFLGIVFFVKYAFEQNLISPAVRVALGFVTGIGLTVGGFRLSAKKAYTVLAHTFCATGVLVLYGVTFAAHALYHFPFFTSLVTFGLMTLITGVAFLLAVRMNALVVAVLGMVGGFLTPILVSTGQDNPFGLFGYITLLDLGLVAVARRQRWLFLTALGAAGTILMQVGWTSKFLISEGYLHGSKSWLFVGVYLWFAAVFAVGAWLTKRRAGEVDVYPGGSALALCGSALLASFTLLGHPSTAQRPELLYTFVLLINVAALFIVWVEPRVRAAQAVVGLLSFVHLTIWTKNHLTADLLPAALVVYLIFGMLHTAFGVIWQRRHPATPQSIAGFIPVVALLLMLQPVYLLSEVSFVVWPAVLLVDLLIIGLAIVTRALLPVLAALVLTLFTTMGWLLKMPHTLDNLPGFLVILCGFAVVFMAASCFLARRVLAHQPDKINDRDLMPDSLAQWLPVCSAVLPFLLLIMASLVVDTTNPAPIFGAALLLTVFLLGLTKFSGIASLPPAALACVLAVQFTWHENHFSALAPWTPLSWYLGFFVIFAAYPFVFRKVFERSILPWAAAAMSGVGAYCLVYMLVRDTWPNGMMGLLPAAFAIPPLLSLAAILKLHKADNPARLSQLAWFGGAALFFITLIFPVQFERQWITLGWAFEGAALCWLYRRIPHGGLRGTGAVLLALAFVRLALNPAVFAYQARSGTPILNWYLYTYGLAAAAMILAALWLNPPRHRWGFLNLRAIFCGMGGVLLFLLLNIEVADYFTPPGSAFIAFEFGESFARDMTYSISWGLFALALLGLGFWLRTAATRYAGMGLLALTLLKLFFHDLANIGSIYRIGALIFVALIALAASFLYQRFLDRSQPNDDK